VRKINKLSGFIIQFFDCQKQEPEQYSGKWSGIRLESDVRYMPIINWALAFWIDNHSPVQHVQSTCFCQLSTSSAEILTAAQTTARRHPARIVYASLDIVCPQQCLLQNVSYSVYGFLTTTNMTNIHTQQGRCRAEHYKPF